MIEDAELRRRYAITRSETAFAWNAEPLSRRPVLGEWLYRSARIAATDAVRSERRRRRSLSPLFEERSFAKVGARLW